MQRFRQMRTLQKFSAVHAAFHNHFNQDRHLIKARRSAALAEWKALAASRSPSLLAKRRQIVVGLTAPPLFPDKLTRPPGRTGLIARSD